METSAANAAPIAREAWVEQYGAEAFRPEFSRSGGRGFRPVRVEWRSQLHDIPLSIAKTKGGPFAPCAIAQVGLQHLHIVRSQVRWAQTHWRPPTYRGRQNRRRDNGRLIAAGSRGAKTPRDNNNLSMLAGAASATAARAARVTGAGARVG